MVESCKCPCGGGRGGVAHTPIGKRAVGLQLEGFLLNFMFGIVSSRVIEQLPHDLTFPLETLFPERRCCRLVLMSVLIRLIYYLCSADGM